MKDGWHNIKNCSVYIEDNKIIRATKLDCNGGEVPAAVYKVNKTDGGYDRCNKVPVETFRKSDLYWVF